MTIIGMKELRTNTEEITRRVHAGERFRVVSRSKPLFDITPIQDDNYELETWLDSYVGQNRELLDRLANE